MPEIAAVPEPVKGAKKGKDEPPPPPPEPPKRVRHGKGALDSEAASCTERG